MNTVYPVHHYRSYRALLIAIVNHKSMPNYCPVSGSEDDTANQPEHNGKPGFLDKSYIWNKYKELLSSPTGRKEGPEGDVSITKRGNDHGWWQRP